MTNANTSAPPAPPPAILECPDGRRLAYHHSAGDAPTIVWLGGFRSDMTGGKATSLHAWAEQAGQAFLRFDYTGHGDSSGDFADGTITQWRDDALTAIDALTEGRLILVGSSMGAWMALLVALARHERIASLARSAPAAH